MYMVSAIIWLVLIFAIRFWKSGVFGWLFLLIPLIIYGINLANVRTSTVDVEDDMFQGNFLSLGYLIVLFIINWEKVKDRKRLLTILMFVLILILFSMFDVWVPKRQIIYIKHLRSILIVAALSLMAYSLYLYYEGIVYYHNTKNCDPTPTTTTTTTTSTCPSTSSPHPTDPQTSTLSVPGQVPTADTSSSSAHSTPNQSPLATAVRGAGSAV